MFTLLNLRNELRSPFVAFDTKKVIQLLDGSISMSYIEYAGDYGERIEKQIAEMIKPLGTGLPLT